MTYSLNATWPTGRIKRHNGCMTIIILKDYITLMAQQEGLILDPVYTGKAFAGLMHLIRTGKIGENETVLFLHSGGTASLFAVDPKDVK